MQCQGYKRELKWRVFGEATNKPNLSPRTKRSIYPVHQKTNLCILRADGCILDSAGTDIGTSHQFPSPPAAFEASGGPTTTISPTFSPPTYQLLPPPTYHSPAQSPVEPIQDVVSHSPADRTRYMSQPNLTPFQFQRNNSLSVSSSYTADSGIELEASAQNQSFTRRSLKSGQSPRLIDLLEPGTDLRATPPEFKDYSSETSGNRYQPGSYSYTHDEPLAPLDDDVEEIVRQPEPGGAWGMNSPSPSPSNSTTSSEGFGLNTPTFTFRQPQLHPGSPEMLMMRFDQQTCGILSVKDGPTENPWRTMVWPLARDSPALYHAISSMTAFHSSKAQPGLRVVGMEHMNKSAWFLAQGLETMRTEIALATTLVLAFAESWDQHISSGTKHLRGARILLNQAVIRHRSHSFKVDDFLRLKFLFNTWIYMDVIARLTSLDDDDSEFFDAVLSNPFGPPISYQNVDPLMGCASTLFPLIGRVANLIRKVRTSSTNSISIISQANELKAELEGWQPSLAFEAPEDPTSDIEHSLRTAESYRWATLLYLHQAVPEIPFKSAAQLASRALEYLEAVPLTSRTIIVQIYPLLAAGCEASSEEDRTWVKDRWEAMMSRMLIGNLDRCWEVIQEVWKRRDADEEQKNQARPQPSGSWMVVGSGLSGSMKQKRKFGSDPDIRLSDGSDPEFAWAKRRATGEARYSDAGTGEAEYLPRRKSVDVLEDVSFDRTVRGRLHWIGVMKDWQWEGRTLISSVVPANSPS